jgi:hypothetical protein
MVGHPYARGAVELAGVEGSSPHCILMANEEFFSDSLHFLGGSEVLDDDVIRYGTLNISIAPKVLQILKSVGH